MNFNSERIEETMKIVDRLHLLDENEMSYVSGVISALVFNKKFSKERENKNGKKEVS